MGKIYFRTVAWNAEKTLKRCVDSVLNQTYRADDIIYYILNNPHTQPDPTEAMVREYAAKEPRIRAFYNRENRINLPESCEAFEFIRNLNDDDYLIYLDCDDAYELSFLEEMLPFMEDNQLDIACCGTDMIDAATDKLVWQRLLPAPLLMTKTEEFSEWFPYYHAFMRTVWGKVYSGRVARQMYTALNHPEELHVTYGSDTIYVFSALRYAKRVGVYPKALHRYYIHPEAGSYTYNSGRPDSDVIRHKDALAYLAAFGPVSAENRLFLARVYANGVSDTVGVLHKTSLAPEEKLHEYRRIAEMPVTRENFRYEHEDIERGRKNLLSATLSCSDITDAAAKADFRALVELLAPRCAAATTPESIELFVNEGLLDAILDDNADVLLSGLLRLLREDKYTKKNDYPAMIRALSAGKPLLANAGDKKFLRRHGDIYLAVWRGQYAEALDKMTGELLDGEKVDEVYLQLYLSLAALQNQVPAFVFGKVQVAELRLKQGDKDGCCAVLEELEEMGVEETDEITALKRQAGLEKV